MQGDVTSALSGNSIMGRKTSESGKIKQIKKLN
jgi:hypothetical protein